ncbi:ATP-NAD kinase, partial [Dentipellis sp. KUC8613]
SPCFVHSHLDNFSEWLKQKQRRMAPGGGVTVARNLQPHEHPGESPTITTVEGGHKIVYPSDDDGYAVLDDSGLDDFEDSASNSLTKQLAETAVGVREMSKQLGRARIKSNIQSILIVTKARDNRLIKLTRELALYLMLTPRNNGRGLVVYVDNQLRTSRRFDAAGIQRDYPELFKPYPRRRSSSNNSSSSGASSTNLSFTSTAPNGDARPNGSAPENGQLRYWTADMCSRSPHLFDFVVTLGGDGTVLFTSWLFQRIVPPVLPFALGSLGFLTNFDFADHRVVMDSAVDNGIRVNLRMRFTCTVYRAVEVWGDKRKHPKNSKKRKAVKNAATGEIMMRNVEKGGWEALESGHGHSGFEPKEGKSKKDKEIMCFTTRPVESFEVINDLVVDRGPSPYVSMLELFGDEHHMTTVQGDGLTIATPTGSTAYSVSAGGSLVHPEIPAILITPICPHTLSFRPMLLPDTMEVRICVPFNSRSTAWASFDGRGRVELKQGDHIKVTASKYPFPTVCADKQSTDWFHSISRTLKWNERERQKSFVVVEEGPEKAKEAKQTKASPLGAGAATGTAHPNNASEDDDDEDEDEDEEDEDEEDEEEEKFDIDDLEASSTTVEIKAPSSPQMRVGAEKAAAELAAEALMGMPHHHHNNHHLFAGSDDGLRSGVDTPNRFMGPVPHPPRISPRHVGFADGAESLRAHAHAHHHGLANGRDEMKTPTASEHHVHAGRRQRSRVREKEREREREETVQPRAFAVWGQDESDSNASDSD